MKANTLLNSDTALKKVMTADAIVSRKKYKHVLTHQIIISTFTIVEQSEAPEQSRDSKFYNRKAIAELPKPVLISKFLIDHQLL